MAKQTEKKKADDTATAKEKKPVAAKAKAKVRKEGTLLLAGLPLLAVMVAVLLVVAGGLYALLQAESATRHAQMADLYRQHFVAVTNDYLRAHERMLAAHADEALLQAADPLAVVNDLSPRYPGVVAASLVTAALDPSVPNGLSYAHQDMVQRALAGQAVAPEISYFRDEQVVTYARAVRGADQRVAAVLLLSVPFKPLANALGSFGQDAGRVELSQRSGSEKSVILRTAESLAVDESAPASATANPGWELRFLPVLALASLDSQALLVAAAVALAALLVAGLMFMVLSSLQRQVKEDVDALDGFSEGFLRYGNRQRPRMHFAVFAGLLGRIEQYGAELRAGKPVVRPLAGADALGGIVIDEGSAGVLGTAPAPKAAKAAKSDAAAPAGLRLRPEIFRAYDIRGVVGDGLDEEAARAIGFAIGSEALARGEQQVVVGRDGRLSSPQLAAALIEGLRASGRNVIDVGMVPTPVLYFAAKTIGTGSGVMITGSHNPGNYNGFKIMLAGDTLAGDEIQALRTRIESSDFSSGAGTLAQQSVASEYVERVSGDIVLARPLKVVIDAGNGVAGAIAPRVLEALGCEVVTLFCDVDGNFPNHHPDPSKPENLEDLMGVVAANNADIGIAFDGDGDRIGVVTAGGRNIFPDRLMMLLSKHVLMTNPGADIIFDVKCTRDLGVLISQLGGRPVMSKTGHSFIKAKLKETGAALAGEMSGHIFFNDRWFGFDDAIYTAARVLEILSLESGNSDQMFEEFPESPVTPEINITVPESKKFALVQALISKASFPDANVITIDGLRVEFAEGWGLLRASNTTPCLVARFEGRTPADLARVQERFRALLAAVDPALDIPF